MGSGYHRNQQHPKLGRKYREVVAEGGICQVEQKSSIQMLIQIQILALMSRVELGIMTGGTKVIYTNANTDKNTGAKVTINSRAPEVPSNGVGDGGGGRGGNMSGGTKIIYTNANTNTNTGAKVTINSRAPEVPSEGVGDGGGGRAGAKYITTNANTNENTGASVYVNSRAGNMKG